MILAASLFVVCVASSVQAHVKPQGPPTLSQGYIVFHVKDDDKDKDSTETISVLAGQYRIGNKDNAGSGIRWPDQTDITPIYFDNIDKGIEPSDCDQIHVDINHSTVGNDNFKFAFTVVLIFTDGTTFTYEHPDTITQTKNDGHGSWDVKKSQLRAAKLWRQTRTK